MQTDNNSEEDLYLNWGIKDISVIIEIGPFSCNEMEVTTESI